MASGDARPIPRKNVAYRVTFPLLDADGDLVTGAAGLDSEISKDGGTFADCTNEATEIATSSGMYYLDLSSTEMNADTVAIIVKTSTSGAKTTPIVIYPAEAGDLLMDGEITAAKLADGAITAAKFAAGALDAVWSVATRTLSAFGFSVTAGTVSDKTGYNLAVTPPTAAEVRAEIDANSTKLDVAVSTRNAVAPDNAGIAAAVAAIAALENLSAADILTTALTESYAAQGAAPTLTQAVLEILQWHTEKGVVGTTMTVNERDGTTPAATYTLNDADAPTSITRAA